MVPKIHAKGSSFKGAAAYLLHDKDRADTDDRVEWTETRNLAANDPDKAWRIMAATAMDQDRLKAEAGVARTGRKSDKHVLHVSLAWHPDQKPTREEMIAAADQAIEAIGARNHQALYVAHNDEKHPHLHLLINRVSPEDGRHLPSSNDRLKLSKWAEGYEKACGEVLCENRVINNEARAKGEYVKGARDISRHIFEKMPKAANDNDIKKGVEARERTKDHAEAQKDRDLAKKHAEAWADLRTQRQDDLAALSKQLAADIAKDKAQVREDFRPDWRALNKHQEAERKTFDQLEQSFFGRAGNIVKTMKLSGRDVSDGARTNIISRSFRILTNAGERRAYFEKAQAGARMALERRQDEVVGKAVHARKEAHKDAQAALRADYVKKREELVAKVRKEKQQRKDAWKARNKERDTAFVDAAQRIQAQGQARDAFSGSSPERSEKYRRMSEKFAKSAKRSRSRSCDKGKDWERE